MANPDTTAATNIDGLLISLPVAIFFLLFTTFIFQFRDSIPYFKVTLWILIIVFTFGVTSGVNVATQYINCKTTNVGKAMLGSIASIVSVLISLVISSISYCRIPISSVFAPLFIGKNVDISNIKSNTNINSLKNSNVKECCVPRRFTLEKVENQFPLVAGIAYGFYIMFGILFGSVIGSGIASIC